MRIGSTATEGLWANAAAFNGAAHRIANANTAPAEGEQPVNLVAEIPQLIVAQHGYTATAHALRALQQTSGALIDVLG